MLVHTHGCQVKEAEHCAQQLPALLIWRPLPRIEAGPELVWIDGTLDAGSLQGQTGSTLGPEGSQGANLTARLPLSSIPRPLCTCRVCAWQDRCRHPEASVPVICEIAGLLTICRLPTRSAEEVASLPESGLQG